MCALQGSFSDEYTATVGVDYDARILDVDGVLVRLHLWDVAGDENFICLARDHINRADGFAFVYDIADDNSFLALPRWLWLVSRCAHARNLPKICLGAKLDLRYRQVIAAHLVHSILKSIEMLYMFYTDFWKTK